MHIKDDVGMLDDMDDVGMSLSPNPQKGHHSKMLSGYPIYGHLQPWDAVGMESEMVGICRNPVSRL